MFRGENIREFLAWSKVLWLGNTSEKNGAYEIESIEFADTTLTVCIAYSHSNVNIAKYNT